MAAPWNPPVKGQDFKFPICLEDYNIPGLFIANPTLAAGDVTISKDGGAFANVTTLGTVTPASGRQVVQELSATEMTADILLVVFHDQTVPPQWADTSIGIVTTA